MSNTILVVENTEGVSEILNISLAPDFNAHTVKNGGEALSVLTTKRFAILICDIDIPDMDGIEFLCKVKKQHPYTEVIMIADPKNAQMAVKSLKYEASDFVIKPVTRESLEIVIERARKKHAINRKLNKPSAPLSQDEPIGYMKQLIDAFSVTAPKTPMLLVDKTNVICHMTHAFEDLFGDCTGKNFADIDPTSPQRHAILTPESSGISEKTQMTTSHGDGIDCVITSVPLKNSQGLVTIILETMTSIHYT